MTTIAATHFVFIDFENVPEVDLSPIGGQAVSVTLLLGKSQKKIDVDLALQIQMFADQIKLVQVGASGHNALDLTLACYLGRAIERAPSTQFAVVSKDKDFDPMIAHLHANNVKIARYDSFAALPFLRHRKPVPTLRTAVATKAVSPAKKTTGDRRDKVIARLKDPANLHRPANEAALRAYIKTALGKETSDIKVEEIVRTLIEQHGLILDTEGEVSYPTAQ